MAWFDASYSYKKKITILAAKVAADAVDFPVLIDITDIKFKDEANGGHVKHASGWDMIFTNSLENTQLSHEIQRYVKTSGRIIYWVKIPSLSGAVNTDIYIYYGKAGVGADPSTTNTWNADYMMVHHMHGANAVSCDDSTANNNDVTGELGNPTYQQAGKIGYAVDFDGALDSLNVADSDTLSFGNGNVGSDVPFTISAWVYMRDATNFIIGGKGTSADREYVFYVEATDKLLMSTYDYFAGSTWYLKTLATNASTGDEGSWVYFTGAYNGDASVGDLDLYRNDAIMLSGDSWNANYVAMHNTATIFRIGGVLSYDSATNGLIDEFRVSRTNRDINWITTNYNNQNDPTNFVDWGEEESQATDECTDYTCAKFTIVGDTYTVELRKPEYGGEDNRISKNLNKKSFWSGDYTVGDEGISSEPLVLTGMEFTICPLTTLVKKMHDILYMSNNNEEVTISGLGDCMDGVYVIKNFRYGTVEKMIKIYAWTMVLEKVR